MIMQSMYDQSSNPPTTPDEPAAAPPQTVTARQLLNLNERGQHGLYQYFIEHDTNRILQHLDTLRGMAFTREAEDGANLPTERPFPSVCLIGLGRCGSNIALDVATLVYNARKFYLNEFNQDDKSAPEQEQRPRRWIRRNLLSQHKAAKPAFLIEPMVMLGDLDKDIKGRIRFSRRGEQGDFINNYNKMKIMDLAEVHAGGAGNAPILGQYLAKIILNKDTLSFSDPDWTLIHSYLVDSCGIKANQSRLYFYIFSAGGGTGSGMASEFGLAQQYAYMSKTFETRNEGKSDQADDYGFVFEPIFTSGICILPNISGQHAEGSEALHINAGRLLCKYLSEEWDFSYNFDNEEAGAESVMRRIRPWNAMMLISNDIMRYAEESEGGNIEHLDVNAMERHANQYISQQIFNILTAQAVTSDYDENYFLRAGIDMGETIRLDANDLFMSLAGPVAVAYAESVVSDPLGSDGFVNKLDIDDLFYRSIDLPHFNQQTQAIEGISLLPIESANYRAALADYKQSGYAAEKLNQLFFFQNCSSVVAILSLPKGYKLSYLDLNRLKRHLNDLFPSTTLKRYALVIGASTNLSLTTLVAKSPCLSDDFLTLIVAYIKRCFAHGNHRFDDSLDNTILDLITADTFDETVLERLLNEYENPAKILDTNWFAIKPMYEKKYRELIRDSKKFVSINDIRLTREHVQKAVCYLREIYRHRIGKTRVVSLNTYSRKHHHG
ncbi:hypothetical protein DK842_04335 [Chromobacterium phragmitis]|uniref:Uncharacterized protein n=2 Tax=Chromobacterium phragmitis TaxID=2202141 RepID=A0A344UH18_9NEIS|nr:hypothetical protein [Chromobacterium phragmitis]AXE29209.1 hypothetical protein DK842_04335 [Chromobacterium phragmitis]AXE34566.1 hypothetical protein DK843_09800 [Chromobacterium phragmitis]